MAERDIFVTEDDFEKLSDLLDGAARRSPKDRQHMDDLAAELERAHVVAPAEIPPDVVTMNSEVALRDLDSDQEMVFSVVFPARANADQQRVSVLAPLGTAVLGYRAGDTIVWNVPSRTRRLQVERVR